MTGMEDTIFAKIIRREIPADIVYEDEDTLAFLDIHPRNPGHTLVVPKAPARNILDISEESLTAIMRTVRKITPAIKAAVDADGITVGINNEAAGGQVIFYMHAHIIPRHAEEDIFPPHAQYKEGEAAEMAAKIREKIS